MTPINLNELTLDTLGTWPAPVKSLCLLIVTIVVVALGYWFFIRHQLEELDTLQAKHTELRQRFELKQHRAANLGAYKKQLILMEKRFGVLLRQLPGKTEIPGLLEDISKTGVRSGLHFLLFDPLNEIEHDFYVELPIKIIVQGNYHQLATFISRIARLNRIVTLHDFIIEPEKAERGQSQSDLLVMKITAKIYRYQEAGNILEAKP